MKRLIAILALGLVTSGARADAPDARATALAGSSPTLTGGAEGLYANPAVLGAPLLGSVAAGLNITGGNNALTLSQMRAVVMGSADDKSKAADEIDKKGKWESRIEATGAAGASVKGIAFAVGQHVDVTAEDVSPLLARIGITGQAVALQANTTYTLKGTARFASYRDYTVGYAHDLPAFVPGMSLAAGAAVRYFKGSAYDEYHEDDTFTTNATPPAFNGAEYYDSASGSGLGFDLGVQASLLGSIKAALFARNLGASIKWTDGTLEKTNPSTFTTVKTTGEKRTQTLPSTITLAGSASVPVVGTSVAVALEQRMNPSATRLHLGAEQSIVGILAFRAGWETAAGAEPSMVTFGLGLGAIIAHLDLAAGIGAGGKGGTVAASANVKF